MTPPVGNYLLNVSFVVVIDAPSWLCTSTFDDDRESDEEDGKDKLLWRRADRVDTILLVETRRIQLARQVAGDLLFLTMDRIVHADRR